MPSTTVRPLPTPKLAAQPGLLRRLLRDPQPVLDELAETVGPVCGLGFGPMRIAVVGDPLALRELFATPTEAFRWNHKYNLLAVVVGPGSMIVSDGGDHKRRRSSVQSAFSRRRLNGWIPMIVERTDATIDDLVESLDPQGPTVDMYRVGRSLVLEIVVRAMFGERLAARAADFGDLFQRAQDYLELPAYRQIPHPLPFTARAQVRRDRRTFDVIVDEEIAHLRAHPTDDRLNVLASLSRLELAERVMRETLRLHPAGVVSPREAAVDVVVNGYRIPKGTLILWSAYLAGRDADAWVEPLRFDPSRFLDLTPTATTVPRLVGMVVNRPEGGVPMDITARTGGSPIGAAGL